MENSHDHDFPAISIHALFGDSKSDLTINTRETVAAAQVILGVDVMTRNEFVVFGSDVLQRAADPDSTEEFSLVRVEIDQDTDELDQLAELVESIKGHHEYESRPRMLIDLEAVMTRILATTDNSGDLASSQEYREGFASGTGWACNCANAADLQHLDRERADSSVKNISEWQVPTLLEMKKADTSLEGLPSNPDFETGFVDGAMWIWSAVKLIG